MSSCRDRLKENLKKQILILEGIYQSDKRFVENFDSSSSDLKQYDEYLSEQSEFLDRLDELDKEYDEIYAYLSSHPEETMTLNEAQRAEIISIIKELEGKRQAVLKAEGEAKAAADTILSNRKSALSASRKTARMIQNSYRPIPQIAAIDQTFLDVSN